MQSIYALFGDKNHTLSLPAAYQSAPPFGADIGGVNPAFFSFAADCEYDSWLTVGVADGSAKGDLTSIGVDFSTWTSEARLDVNDGAVFWLDPQKGPGGSGETQTNKKNTKTRDPKQRRRNQNKNRNGRRHQKQKQTKTNTDEKTVASKQQQTPTPKPKQNADTDA
jgi:hypothetical protein